MNKNFIENINQILQILSQDPHLNFSHPQLPHFTDSEISTPIGDIFHTLTKKRTNLQNYLVDLSKLKELVDLLSEKKTILRLSHIGFCYKVKNLIKEKERLVSLSKEANFSLFQEPSSDDGLWLFLGNISNWQDPVIEFVPIAHTSDKDADYWLPHVQIDIDTSLDGEGLTFLIKKIFDKDVVPFPIIINDVTYIVRNRLGCIDGINIFLDLATNQRNVPYLREKIWKKIN